MTEDDARRVLLLRAFESPPGAAAWTDEDRAWATRQAVAAVGDGAAPARFVAARAALAMSRLLPRDADAARWLQRRWWHPLWLPLALVLGALAGVVADQLGPPQRVNLLAPAVWAVVLWNLLVYAALLLPSPRLGWLARGLGSRLGGLASRPSLHADWLRAASPLLARRAALLMHLAASGLALGLVAGLYLRGLAMDYRVGWQSTFLDAAGVQAGLSFLLAPAAWLTGIAVPAVAPLQLAPGAAGSASAAPWIHLLAATLLLAVVLPRLGLAAWAAAGAAVLSRRLPLELEGDYFEALHPLMRPGTGRPLTLLWCPLAPPAAPVRLLGQELALADDGEQRLFDAGDGERVHLRAVPSRLQGSAAPRPWWRRLVGADAATRALQQLQREVDAVLLVLPADAATPRPAWLGSLSRPLVVLEDSSSAVAPALPLRALDDGWLADGALWQALQSVLPDDRRRQRLAAAWHRRQEARLAEAAALIATSLARLATAREPLPEPKLFGRSAADEAAAAEAPRARLVQQLDEAFVQLAEQLAPAWGRADASPPLPPPLPPAAVQPRLAPRVGEGRAALWGGVLSGTLAGLKADLATGGLTMGAGAVAGGVIGALGAAGVARGINSVRGTAQGHAVWGADELDAIAAAMLRLPLALATRQGEAALAARLQPALAAEAAALAAAWRDRSPTLAERLAPPLQRALKAALGGP